MAFDKESLNNIGGSIGKNNLWLYYTEDTVEDVFTINYFVDAVLYHGMKYGDCILIHQWLPKTFLGVVKHMGGVVVQPLNTVPLT